MHLSEFLSSFEDVRQIKKIEEAQSIKSVDAETRAQLARALNVCIAGAVRILDTSNLLRRNIPHKVLAGYYHSTKKLTDISGIWVDPRYDPKNPGVIRVRVGITKFTKAMEIFELQLSVEYLSEATGVDVTKWDPALLRSLLSYTVWAYSRYRITDVRYFFIDDRDLLITGMARARKYIDTGNPELLKSMLPMDVLEKPIGYDFANGSSYDEVPIKEVCVFGRDTKTKEYKVVDLPGMSMTPYKGATFPKVTPEDSYAFFALQLLAMDYVSYDLETTGLDPYSIDIVSCGLSWNHHFGYYVSIKHEREREKANSSMGSSDLIRQRYKSKTHGLKNISELGWKELLSVLAKKKVMGHNLKYDWSVTKMQGFGTDLDLYFDTMVADYIARPSPDVDTETGGMKVYRGLKFVAPRELGIRGWKDIDVTDIQHENAELAALYCVRDVCHTFALSLVYFFDLETIKVPDKEGNETPVQFRLFHEIEMPYVKLLAITELEGVGIDQEHFKKVRAELETKRKTLYDDFFKMSGLKESEFNIKSTPQLSDLFYNKMGVKPYKRCKNCFNVNKAGDVTCPICSGELELKHATPGGQPSLSKFALDDMDRDGNELAGMLMEYRNAEKLLSTYMNLPDKVNPHSGYLHPSYDQVRTATGRLSSRDPNFQGIP